MDKLTEDTNNRITQILSRAYYHQIELPEARKKIKVYSTRIGFFNKKYLQYKRSAENWHHIVEEYMKSFETQKKQLQKENKRLKRQLKDQVQS